TGAYHIIPDRQRNRLTGETMLKKMRLTGRASARAWAGADADAGEERESRAYRGHRLCLAFRPVSTARGAEGVKRASSSRSRRCGASKSISGPFGTMPSGLRSSLSEK